MAVTKKGGALHKPLTALDYRKIANSHQSQNIAHIASWLPKRIEEIHHLYNQVKNRYIDIPIISQQTWHQLAKVAEYPTYSNSFLGHGNDLSMDKQYQACCIQVARTVAQLEKILIDTINAWSKADKLFKRHRPEECLIKNINLVEDFQYIQKIARTLKEIYAAYPDQDELLFANKAGLSLFIEEIEPNQPTRSLLRNQ